MNFSYSFFVSFQKDFLFHLLKYLSEDVKLYNLQRQLHCRYTLCKVRYLVYRLHAYINTNSEPFARLLLLSFQQEE